MKQVSITFTIEDVEHLYHTSTQSFYREQHERFEILKDPHNLINKKTESFRIDADSVIFEYFKQILLHILKYEVEPTLSFECFFEEDYVFVLKQPEHLNLPHDSLLCDLILVRFLEFFYADWRLIK